jgi:S1-C subfamily serine protease
MTVLQNLSDDLAAAVTKVSPSLVAIHARRRIPSSGILWRPDVIVTNHHTLQREEGITVTLDDGSRVSASLAGRDPSTDVAVLRLDQPAGPAVGLATADPAIGQLVLALGRPGKAVTAALGIVSAVGGAWRTWSGGRIDHFVRLDVAVYDGFSGGALSDAEGLVIGMNSSGLSRASAMTIPFSTVARVAEQLLTTGHVRRGYVGLGLQPVRLPSAAVQRHALPQDVGLMVVSLDDHSPATTAGMQLGDVIVAFDGRPAAEPSDLLAQLSGDRVGTTAVLRVLRAGEIVEVAVVIGERAHSTGRKR